MSKTNQSSSDSDSELESEAAGGQQTKGKVLVADQTVKKESKLKLWLPK